MRLRRASGFAVTLGLLTATVALAPSTAGAGGTPLWVKHVRNYLVASREQCERD